MTNNKDWQKFNLMSVFGSAPAIRHQFQLGITTYYPEQDRKDVDRWLVASTLGTKSARKMALEHKHRGWMPLASVAAHLSGTAGVARVQQEQIRHAADGEPPVDNWGGGVEAPHR